MIDIDKLEMLAKAATPGPWHSPGLGEVHDDHNDKVILDVCWQEVGVPFEDSFSGGRQDDAHFVAAANPAAIIALIAEVRALRDAAAIKDASPTVEREPVECSQWRWRNGMSAPRTCARCGLGPCREPSVASKEKA
jgi:hypothetical protein